MDLYNIINEEVKRRGGTIAALEREAGIGNGAIAGWKNSSPTLKKLEAVAAALGMKASDLLKEVEDGTQV